MVVTDAFFTAGVSASLHCLFTSRSAATLLSGTTFTMDFDFNAVCYGIRDVSERLSFGVSIVKTGLYDTYLSRVCYGQLPMNHSFVMLSSLKRLTSTIIQHEKYIRSSIKPRMTQSYCPFCSPSVPLFALFVCFTFQKLVFYPFFLLLNFSIHRFAYNAGARKYIPKATFITARKAKCDL